MDDLQRINEAAQEIRDSLTSLDSLASDKRKEAEQLDESIKARKTELDGLNVEVANSKTRRDEALAADTSAVQESSKALESTLAELDRAQTDLKAAKREHQQFVAYQSKAQKALQSREEAILKKEKELDEIIGQAKRRMGILNNVV